jgi:hypothetical protein
LYALERRSRDTEFFFLCSNCAGRYDLYLDPAGGVSIRPRGTAYRGLPTHSEEGLRVVTRSTSSLPRLKTVPSGERRTTYGPDVNSVFAESRGPHEIHR